MTGLVERVRRALDPKCLVKGGLKKKGCKVMMTDAPSPRLIVDFDKPGSPLAANATRCDYLLIAEGEHADGWVVVIELKGGRLDADEIVRQLRAGASAAERFVHQGEAFRFRPVAASGSVPKYERTKLRDKANMIGFHGHEERVRLMHCGDRLAMALRS